MASPRENASPNWLKSFKPNMFFCGLCHSKASKTHTQAHDEHTRLSCHTGVDVENDLSTDRASPAARPVHVHVHVGPGCTPLDEPLRRGEKGERVQGL